MNQLKALNIRLHNCKNQVATIEEQIEALHEQRRDMLQEIKSIEAQLKTKSNNTIEGTDSSQFGKTNYPWSHKAHNLLETVFGLKQFRSHQLATINATLSGYDVLLVMPTGGGKSLCFQLTALLQNGVTVVVSPLISLMEDQLNALNELGIPTAILNCNTSRESSCRILKCLEKTGNVDNIGFRLLYVTPEKLAKSKRIMVQLEKCYNNHLLKRFVIDEVHCCSQWGHDFRTDYQFLGIMRNQFPHTPIMGLTATATPTVIADIQKILNIQGCFVFKDSFYRDNLNYCIKRTDGMKKEDQINDMVELLRSRYHGECGLIYCLTVREVDELAEKLRARQIRAASYHAQLPMERRNRTYQDWFANRAQVIVATIAFGMGINKLDVRFVIHASMSKSLENYYQETGRAGRDGKPADCILYYKFADIFRATTLVFSEKNGLANVYSMVAYCVNQSTCLKEQIANYFHDKWNNNCSLKCDNCRRSMPHESRDVSEDMQTLACILQHATQCSTRLTAPKLIEIWMGKGGKKLQPPAFQACQHSREMAHNVLLSLLLGKYLREEFHFTPYSTISYINLGAMWTSRGGESAKIVFRLPLLASPSLKKTKSATSTNSKKLKVETPSGSSQDQNDGPSIKLETKEKIKPKIEKDKPNLPQSSSKPSSRPEVITLDSKSFQKERKSKPMDVEVITLG